MINHINQIAKLITEDPDIINNKTILKEDIEKDVKKLLNRIKSKLNHEINIDEITEFSTQQQFKELGISKWLAKQIAINPNLRVDWQSLTDYIAHIKLREPIKYKSLFKKKLSEVESESEEWHSQFQANDDVTMTDDEPIITQLPNGYKIVKLTTKEHCSAEGEAMGHCVGGYDPKVDDLYSLRDPRGRPHVTIQIKHGFLINQIKGKQNEPPVRKYADLVIPWVNSILEKPGELFSNPLASFTYEGFDDYLDSLSNDDLRKFANNGSDFVKRRVVENSNAPTDILRALSKDDNEYVRMTVAKNPNTPIDLLRTLSKDDNDLVRAEVAKNPSTPLDVLRFLVKDDGSIRHAASVNLEKKS